MRYSTTTTSLNPRVPEAPLDRERVGEHDDRAHAHRHTCIHRVQFGRIEKPRSRRNADHIKQEGPQEVHVNDFHDEASQLQNRDDLAQLVRTFFLFLLISTFCGSRVLSGDHDVSSFEGHVGTALAAESDADVSRGEGARIVHAVSNHEDTDLMILESRN